MTIRQTDKIKIKTNKYLMYIYVIYNTIFYYSIICFMRQKYLCTIVNNSMAL